jgi:hypothetical protein
MNDAEWRENDRDISQGYSVYSRSAACFEMLIAVTRRKVMAESDA